MKKMTSSEIRQMWLDFFKSKGHHVEPGASLIPINDPTLLWINAGVSALKKYFDGSEIPPSRRITNAQKCIRTNDIEHVGFTARHHTFFEMLGNFSIGDYFRHEVIPWAKELLTDEKWFNFPQEKLYITYHPEDLDTKKTWMSAGIEEDHLIPIEGNFWEIGEGPCGPDTEIFFDRGEKYDPDNIGIRLLKEDIENDRYIEIWNIVFSQFNSETGKKRSEYKELPSKNIDTGAGLERFCCIIQGTDTNFETDLFYPIIEHIEKISKQKYNDNPFAFRVIADHIRSCTFALADGEMFSNEGRGYVLRRLLRRAVRYGKVLNIHEPFLSTLVDDVCSIMESYYPYLNEKKEFVKRVIESEENKFLKTLENGEDMLLRIIEKNGGLSGEEMFLLYDTYGFPKELTLEICEEHNIKPDIETFNKLMKEQKERARAARGDQQSMNKQSPDLMAFVTPSTFDYSLTKVTTKVVGLFKDGKKVDSISDNGEVILEVTPFYAESGGQVADIGLMKNDHFEAKVSDVHKAPNKQHLHSVDVLYGEIKVGDEIEAEIDVNRRLLIARNHSSVHLLQQALIEVLGDHIAQHGSYVSSEYSHFDFSHFKKLSEEEIAEVERKVNNWIALGIKEETRVLPIEEARKIGAKALFNDKYGDTVRVVMFGDVSKEFCGGTHVSSTSDIGIFVIESEESVASGVRRITARTSLGAYQLLKKRENMLNIARTSLGASSYVEVNPRLNSLMAERNDLKKQLETLNQKIATLQSRSIVEEIKERDGINYLAIYLAGASRDNIFSILDSIKSKYNDHVFIFIGEVNLPIVVSVSGKAKDKYNAGMIVKKVASILGGSGGGRPDMASGAGKDPSKIDEALKVINE